jgi:thiamine biosynthesis lipoprotein
MSSKNEVAKRFRAMNTDVEIVAVTREARATAATTALATVESLFHHSEAVLSRFLPSSELSALNSAAGRAFTASPLLFTAVSAALAAARDTAGLFDPTILPVLLAAGYDRSFELLNADQGNGALVPACKSRWEEIEMDPVSRTIGMPAGCSLDLGGIGKGLTIDRAAAILEGFHDFAIDAGGDMRFSGVQADGSAWTVGVQDPMASSRDLMQLDCSNCALATSTIVRRRWLRGGRIQHHIIDPRTGLPSTAGAIAATVITSSAARADTLAKAAVILGPSAGLRLIESQTNTEGLLVLEGGYVQQSSGLRELLRAA